jgi:hypothetical protein
MTYGKAPVLSPIVRLAGFPRQSAGAKTGLGVCIRPAHGRRVDNGVPVRHHSGMIGVRPTIAQ